VIEHRNDCSSLDWTSVEGPPPCDCLPKARGQIATSPIVDAFQKIADALGAERVTRNELPV